MFAIIPLHLEDANKLNELATAFNQTLTDYIISCLAREVELYSDLLESNSNKDK